MKQLMSKIALSSQANPSRMIGLPLLSSLLGLLLITTLVFAQVASIYQTDIPGPAGSGSFGGQVAVLPNGNIVVADPFYSSATASHVGAVYLYDGDTLALISMLTGSTEDDQIGSGQIGGAEGVTVLSNGDFVVASPYWNNGASIDAGALTWVSAVTGLSGEVSPANSLVGDLFADRVGADVLALTNGNYVVGSPSWHNNLGAATWVNVADGLTGNVSASNSFVGGESSGFVGDEIKLLSNGNFLVRSANAGKGAVTWGSAAAGLPIGTLSAANSLVGSVFGDSVGAGSANNPGLIALNNGNYVVNSPPWHNGNMSDAGAVTWGNGSGGTVGVVSSANSLVGTHTGDDVGYAGNYPGVVPLVNGNYVVVSYIWDSPSVINAGAVTWGNGATGRSGIVSAANSLIGSHRDDFLGFMECTNCPGVVALSNGNYVVSSPFWDNGDIGGAGAATWANGATGIAGTISAANSLVGSSAGDEVGLLGGVALPNGNYLVRSPYWNQHHGAVTWGDGTTGITGTVSAANSLVGHSFYDEIGFDGYVNRDTDYRVFGVTVLANGNYVVSSPNWDNADLFVTNVGAVTWGSAATGIVGEVSDANSLVGSHAYDKLGLLRDGTLSTAISGLDGVIPLIDGNYLVASSYWDNGATPDAGAVTWANGGAGAAGAVTPANSLVGGSSGDQIGQGGITVLTNGNFVVASPYWDNGAEVDAGAATWVNSTAAITGPVSAANSLVGGDSYDLVGADGVDALPNGGYVVRSHYWSDFAAGKAEVGAVTWASSTGIQGVVSAANSLVGGSDGDWVGIEALTILSNSDYFVYSPGWNNGTTSDAGAVSWGRGVSGVSGAISGSNSVLGASASQGNTMNFQPANNNTRLVVGRDVDNIVTIVELVPRLVVYRTGTGTGTVSSDPAGIDCGNDCSELFSENTIVTLVATPGPDSTFSGWSGGCSGMGDCIVTMDAARTVTANFTASSFTLATSLAGTGSGTIASTPAGIDCGSVCSAQFDAGSVITLTATPAVGSTFSGWSGDCTGTGDCVVTMDSAQAATAAFTINSYALLVMRNGTGSGAVSSDPSGIDCGIDCSETYTYGTLVTLTASPGPDSTFAGWSGACAGAGDCVVTMESAEVVTATFTAIPSTFTLTTNLAGTGAGTITSDPAGIDCGSDCSEAYNSGTLVTLTATPAPGSTFTAWSGDCAGAGDCAVSMDAARVVTATFIKTASMQLFLPLISAP